MRVGIANPFAYRPHVGHMEFLARQLTRLKHDLFFLGCQGELTDCNSRISKVGLAHRLECMKCHAGGIRSYLDVHPARVDLPVDLDANLLDLGRAYAYSSVASALQVEHPSEAAAPDFVDMQTRLSAPAGTAFANARRWIRDNALDCVFLFNGRYDLTRAILEACVAEKARFVSVERSWFGAGLQLLPNENCIGLQTFHAICGRWRTRPLTRAQATRASEIITRRLNRTSVGEWKQYNVKTGAAYERSSIKYLYLPSSQHEWLGQWDRTFAWHHPVEGIEALFKRLGVPLSELVVRGHPGWAMRIKHYGANRASEFYRKWAEQVGAEYIDPAQPVDTHGLIRRAGLILLNGSSASMEAAWRGKPLVCFVPSAFSTSGIARNLLSQSDVDQLTVEDAAALADPEHSLVDPVLQCRLALRYIYCVNYRIMQFVDSVQGINPFSFEATDPADLSGLQSLVTEGVLREEDSASADDEREEGDVVHAILAEKLDTIVVSRRSGLPVKQIVRRRSAYRLLDWLAG